jgi:hypothetical protein
MRCPVPAAWGARPPRAPLDAPSRPAVWMNRPGTASIPKGLCPPAQRCEARAALGDRAPGSNNPNGLVAVCAESCRPPTIRHGPGALTEKRGAAKRGFLAFGKALAKAGAYPSRDCGTTGQNPAKNQKQLAPVGRVPPPGVASASARARIFPNFSVLGFQLFEQGECSNHFLALPHCGVCQTDRIPLPGGAAERARSARPPPPGQGSL